MISPQLMAKRAGHSLNKMVAFALNGILGSSTVLLQLLSRLGSVLTVVAFLGVLDVVGVVLVFPAQAVSDWASSPVRCS